MATSDVDWAGAADAQEKSLVNRVGDLNVNNGAQGTRQSQFIPRLAIVLLYFRSIVCYRKMSKETFSQ